MPSNNIGSIEQIFALQPEGVVGGDINPLNMELIRGGGSDSSTFFRDLDYMDMLEAAEDEELFRMLGVKDATPLEQRQQEAAQKYADLVTDSPSTAEEIAAVDAAKAKLVELDVSRDQLNEAGIDASRGISGVMGPSISGALEGGIEKASELFGLGAEGIASLIGADKALSSALLNVPKPGVTFVFGEGGQKRPLITGQTPAGTQVGVTDPYGIFDILGGIQEGSLGIEDIIAGGAGAVAAATALSDDDDKTKKTGVDTGVNVTLGDESGADPATKVADDATTGDAVDIIERTPTDRVIGDPLTLPDFDPLDLPSNRTLELPDFDPTATERVPTPITPAATPADEVPADKTPAGGDGGGGGGGTGLPEQSASPTGGIRGMATEQAGVADIAMLYDPSLSLAENMARILGKGKNKQGDAVDSALMYGGGIVQPTDLNDELLRILGSR